MQQPFLTSPRGSSRHSVDVHSPHESNDVEVQIILKGDMEVGKKSLMRSFMSSEISAEASFIHSTWSSKRCTIDGQTYRVRVGIEHISVSEPLPPSDPNYCGHMLCYDVTNQRSFDSVMHLAGFRVQTLAGDKHLRRSSLGNTSSKSPTPLVSPLPTLASLPPVALRPLSEPSMIVVGTKADLVKQRSIAYEGAKRDALSVGLEYVETSARDSFGVDVAFILLLCNIHERLKRFVNPHQQGDAIPHRTDSSGAISKLRASLSLSGSGKQKLKDTVITPAPVVTAGLGSRLVSDAIKEELAFQAYQSWLTDLTMRSLRLGSMGTAQLDTLLKNKFAVLDSESPFGLAIQAIMNAGYLLAHNPQLTTVVLETAFGKGSSLAVWNTDCAQALSPATHLTDLTIRGYDLNANPFWHSSYLPWHLTGLNLSACNIHTEALRRISLSLRHCDRLERLNLSRNPLKSTDALARCVILLRGVLKSLDVSECDIGTEDDVRPLMQAVSHSMLRTLSLLKNPLSLDAVRNFQIVYVFSCAPAFAALATLLVDRPQESLTLHSAHELWLALQANATLTDLGSFLRDIDSHRLSEAAAYLDRNKKLQLKAKRSVPQLTDLASWAIRKSALLFRPIHTLQSFVHRKLPTHLCPPLRRLVECAIPSAEVLDAWCHDSRSPALFPASAARTFAALPRLQLKHNRGRLKRTATYRAFHDAIPRLPVGALLVLIDMSGRDIDSAQRQLRRLYPALANPNHNQPSAPISSTSAPMLVPAGPNREPSPNRSPRRALTYFNSPSPRANSATEAEPVKKLAPVVYFNATARAEGPEKKKEDKKLVYFSGKDDKKKENEQPGKTEAVPAARGLSYFSAKAAAASAEEKEEPKEETKKTAGGLTYYNKETKTPAEEKKKDEASSPAPSSSGAKSRGLAYFPGKAAPPAAEEKKVEEVNEEKQVAAKPASRLAYFPAKAAAGEAEAPREEKKPEEPAAKEALAPRKGLAYYPGKAVASEEKKAEEPREEAKDAPQKPAARGLAYYPPKASASAVPAAVPTSVTPVLPVTEQEKKEESKEIVRPGSPSLAETSGADASRSASPVGVRWRSKADKFGLGSVPQSTSPDRPMSASRKPGLVYYPGDSDSQKEDKRQSAEKQSAERAAAAAAALQKKEDELKRLEEERNMLRNSPAALVPVELSLRFSPPSPLPSPHLLRHRSLAYFPGNPPSPLPSPHSSQAISPPSQSLLEPISSPVSTSPPSMPSPGRPNARSHLTYYSSQDPVQREKSPRRTLSYFPSHAASKQV